MGDKVRLWRWRSNPLRRRTDVMEAWVVLAVGVAMAVGGPVAGAMTAVGVNESLLQQRHERRPAQAVLLADVPVAPEAADVPLGQGRPLVTVRWTAPDGSIRTGQTRVSTGGTAGTAIPVWIDSSGRLTKRPPTPDQAEAQADLMGASVATGVCAVLLAGRGVVRWRLDRIRAAQWERDWAEVGPQWRHRHT